FVPANGFQLWGLALPIFAIACLALAASSRPVFTIATHLSAAYAMFLIASWQGVAPTVSQASLGSFAIPPGGQYVMAIILGTCLVSFAVTHLLYFLAVGKEIGVLAKAVSGLVRTIDRASA